MSDFETAVASLDSEDVELLLAVATHSRNELAERSRPALAYLFAVVVDVAHERRLTLARERDALLDDFTRVIGVESRPDTPEG